ncbi:AAA family ATPase [Novosphingobium umbonatum]|nr:AAA family ATPase [Novosphingobium umbonatum]
MAMMLGHEAPWREWRQAMAGHRMHHAWILSGPQGVGKGSFALAAAAELVAEAGVPQPEPDAHPDILIPEHPPATKEDEKKREAGQPFNRKRAITIDEIRNLQRRLTTRPTLGRRRVVIIDPADHLEKNAVNCLLKSLEEPPEGTYFLLVAHRIGRLLPTIRSRCRILRFAPLPDAQVELVLSRAVPNSDEATRAAAIVAAQGSPGVALEFVEEDLAPVHQLMQRLLDEGDAGFRLRGALSAELGARPSRERVAATFELARAVLAGALRGADPARQARLIEAHSAVARLGLEAPQFNYDAAMLAMELGGLIAAAH